MKMFRFYVKDFLGNNDNDNGISWSIIFETYKENVYKWDSTKKRRILQTRYLIVNFEFQKNHDI